MVLKFSRFRTAAMLFLATAVTSGCALSQNSLVKSGHVRFVKEYDGKVDITSADAYRDGNDMIIMGKVGRRHSRSYSRFAVRGHVDVEIIDLDENRKKIIAPISPSRIKGKGGRSSFQVKVPSEFSEGAVVRLRFHRTNQSFGSSSPHEFN